MGIFRSVVLYAALALGANSAVADIAGLEALREGLMKKLVFHSEPKSVSDKVFTDPDGGKHQLADYQGKYILLNFWATWCAPCRKEMPSLDNLQETLGGEKFKVVTVATGRNTLPGIERFFQEADVTNLPILLDPKQALARDMGVLGLPITVILDPDGNEIARLRGDAEWDTDSAMAIIKALIASMDNG
ncbi:MAG: TlpA family protein disulfide reductase [Marinosulfonomonas sp.]|nr:TlpA family protein disulfide reductase [Marinosulfonomonas sp.]